MLQDPPSCPSPSPTNSRHPPSSNNKGFCDLSPLIKPLSSGKDFKNKNQEETFVLRFDEWFLFAKLYCTIF